MSNEASGKKEKKSRGGRVLRWLIVAVLAGVFAFSVIKVTDIMKEYKEGRDIYDGFRDGYGTKIATAEEPEKPARKPQEEAVPQEDAGLYIQDYSAYEHPKKLRLLHTTIDFLLVPQFSFDFEGLRAENPDVCGWIMIDGTYVDYPVVQGEDNVYYLRRAANGEQNNAGSVFADFRHKSVFYEKNNILYAHNQRNHRMFHQLLYYQDRAYLEEHPYAYIYLPDGSMQIYRIYACHIEAGTRSYTVSFPGEQDFADFIAYTQETAMYDSGIPVFPSDRILTLVTCTDEGDENRVVLHAVLVQHVEAAEKPGGGNE